MKFSETEFYGFWYQDPALIFMQRCSIQVSDDTPIPSKITPRDKV